MNPDLDQAAAFLLDLGRAVRNRAIGGRDLERDSIAVTFAGGDTIYAIDRRVEDVIVSALDALPPPLTPLTLVAEGMESNTDFGFGPATAGRYRLLIDPIDGTRPLMYDKRPAWFLAALAPDRGPATRLADVVVSVLVEIPTSKQSSADLWWAIGSEAFGRRESLATGETLPLSPRPSSMTTLEGGFAQVSNFFPGTKRLAADLMERIVAAVIGPGREGQAAVFDDQYTSTGGQLVELLSGRDRFCCDLRPLFYRALEAETGQAVPHGLECHPYDLAGAHVARAAGVILTDGFGRPLDGPFDTGTGMHWIGYANAALYRSIAPVIAEWLAERGVSPPGPSS